MERMTENFKAPEPNLTEADFVLADEILDSLVDNPMGALKLYMRAKPEVKKMLGNVDPRELLIQIDPSIESQRVVEYFSAYENKDELGMRRAYTGSNRETQREIDELIK